MPTFVIVSIVDAVSAVYQIERVLEPVNVWYWMCGTGSTNTVLVTCYCRELCALRTGSLEATATTQKKSSLSAYDHVCDKLA
jgi:hypothetical protein